MYMNSSIPKNPEGASKRFMPIGIGSHSSSAIPQHYFPGILGESGPLNRPRIEIPVATKKALPDIFTTCPELKDFQNRFAEPLKVTDHTPPPSKIASIPLPPQSWAIYAQPRPPYSEFNHNSKSINPYVFWEQLLPFCF